MKSINLLLKERENKIASIEKALREHPETDLKKLVFEICSIFNCTERKAKEYINTAKWRIDDNPL